MQNLNVPEGGHADHGMGLNLKSLITLWVTLSISMESYGLTGNVMKGMCDPDRPFADRVACLSYVRGAHEMYLATSYLGGPRIYCLAEGVIVYQMAEIGYKYMNENPELLHQDFIDLLILALSEVFPCEE